MGGGHAKTDISMLEAIAKKLKRSRAARLDWRYVEVKPVKATIFATSRISENFRNTI